VANISDKGIGAIMPEEHSSKPNGSPTSLREMRDYFTLWFEKMEQFLAERDKRYDERFDASTSSITNALSALDKQTVLTSSASDKAIQKALEAQQQYNIVHNDLARKMDAQYKEMVTRDQHVQEIKYLTEKIEEAKNFALDRYETNRNNIQMLQEYKGMTLGKETQGSQDQTRQTQLIMLGVGVISLGISGCGLLVSIVVNIILKYFNIE
jgi:hypothetical protein